MENLPGGHQEKAPISKEEVVRTLDAHEPYAPEAMEVLRSYIDQCHNEADLEAQAHPEDAVVHNRANIEAEIKIALVYLDSTKYIDDGLQSLEDAWRAASQNETTTDLAIKIEEILQNRR